MTVLFQSDRGFCNCPLAATARLCSLGLLAAVIFNGCSRSDGTVSWHSKYLDSNKYDYLHAESVIIDMCKQHVINIGDSKNKIHELLGVSDTEYITKLRGVVYYSYEEYHQFVFEYNEHDAITAAYEATEEGAAISGYQAYSLQ